MANKRKSKAKQHQATKKPVHTRAKKKDVVSESLKSLEAILKSPEKFLKPRPHLVEDVKQPAKALFDSLKDIGVQKSTKTMQSEDSDDEDVLDSLYMDGFDVEQIWQQLDLKFNIFKGDSDSFSEITKLITSNDLHLPVKNQREMEQTVEGESEELDQSDEDMNEVGDNDEEHSESEDEDLRSEDEDLASEGEETDTDNEMTGSDEEMNDIDEGLEDSECDSGEEPEEGKSDVDDKFFKLNDMERFLDMQDDMFEKDPVAFERQLDELYESDESEDPGYGYSDLFPENTVTIPERSTQIKKDKKLTKSKNSQKLTPDAVNSDDPMSDEDAELLKVLAQEIGEGDYSESGDDNSESSDGEHIEDVIGRRKHEPAKSQFEERTERLRSRIEQLESEALEDKPWQLMGEVTASKRPENSLIEEDVEFDSNVAPAPVITAETTQTLEELIKQRIKDKAFDDVVRKERLKDDSEKFRKRIELSNEKSKLSLSQVYEQEYLKAKSQEDDDKVEERDPREIEIEKMMKSLFSKLDALAAFRYTPKPAPEELNIVSHLPAMVVEEVQPDTIADASRLAPEEVKRAVVEVKDRSEMDSTDKKRIRRKKRVMFRKKEKVMKKAQKNIEKINPGLGNKRAQQRTLDAIKEAVVHDSKIIRPTKESDLSKKIYSSSKEFFKALNNEVKRDKQVVRKKSEQKQWNNRNKTELTVKKLKL